MNLKQKRTGSVFQEMFKAVLIETDEQLVHVSRYILLNPYTSHVIKTLAELENYEWSSFLDYTEKRISFVDTALIMGFFSSIEEFKQFVFDQAAYQRNLAQIKHLVIE